MSHTALPRLSVVVPCRNERRYIERCIQSLVGNGYPLDRLEVIVADGASDDGTRAALTLLERQHPVLRVIDNPEKITPVGINLAIGASTGALVCLAGAHNAYPPAYLEGLVRWSLGSGCEAVGGTLDTVPENGGAIARGIAFAMAHPFGVGDSHFRTGTTDARLVDTVPMGCYRRDVFDRIGPFDVELVRNQDDEFNFRLGAAGGRLLLVPDVRSSYVARGSLGKLWRMFFQYGLFKPLVVRKTGGVHTVRQLVPAAFVIGVLLPVLIGLAWPPAGLVSVLALAAYGAAAMTAALAAVRTVGFAAASTLMTVFPTMHVAYGIGYLVGAVRVGLRRRQGFRSEAVGLSR